MIQLSYLSDNQIKLTSLKAEGGEVEINPATEWLKIHLRCGGRSLSAVNSDTERKYCHIDTDGKLVLDIPSKAFNGGELEYMIEVREDSDYFKDGYKNTFPKEYKPTGIEIV